MKILMLSAEVFPFAKTGGLADVAGALPRALHALGHDVRVVMPRYGRIDPVHFNLQKTLDPFPVPLDSASEDAAILEGKLDTDVPVYFIENKKFFDREGIYMYPDDAERFIFFSRAALEMLKRLNWQPDVIHCHDWHTALVPNWLRTVYASDPFFADAATVYTIHNIAYQGIFGYRVLEVAGLAPYGFIAHPSVAPEINQVFDFMARGILFADKINTVSETYARDIQTPEFGERLDPILRERKDRLSGILNGIDTERFDPARDSSIAQTFSIDSLDARAANKLALQKEGGLPQIPDAPLLAMVSRLTDQKGLDLVADTIDHILDTLPAQFVLMGTGDQHYHDFFSQLRSKYPGRVATFLTYDPALARRIYAGADMLLMPSRSEPSGTNQMIAMRYGCIPIVRATGGLADSVEEFDARQERGTGFTFKAYDRWAMFAAVARAMTTYQLPEVWRSLQCRAMSVDLSWNAAAKKYDALYRDAIERHGRATQAAHALALDIQHTAEKIAALAAHARLGELAYNLWWGWNPDGRVVFQRLDPELWERVARNPVRLLRELPPETLLAASRDEDYLKRYDAALADFDSYIKSKATWFDTSYPYLSGAPIAYFSFEFGLHASLPIYSGGLGILSGDHTKEASDLGLPFVGIGFLYPQGYFTQRINAEGWQEASYDKMNFALAPAVAAKDANGRQVIVEVELPGRSVYAQVWRIQVGRVPLFLMDTDIDANAPADRELAAHLYGGDRELRLIQEYVLGIGGVRTLRALGYHPRVWHLNEGHCAFSVLERARERRKAGAFQNHRAHRRVLMKEICRDRQKFFSRFGVIRRRRIGAPSVRPEMIELFARAGGHGIADDIVRAEPNADRFQVAIGEIVRVRHQNSDDALGSNELLRERNLEQTRHEHWHAHTGSHLALKVRKVAAFGGNRAAAHLLQAARRANHRFETGRFVFGDDERVNVHVARDLVLDRERIRASISHIARKTGVDIVQQDDAQPHAVCAMVFSGADSSDSLIASWIHCSIPTAKNAKVQSIFLRVLCDPCG